MLVLTRKNQEVIRIGENITVTILKIKGQAVSVGIDAPRAVRIIRGELPEKATETSPEPVAVCTETSVQEETTEPSDSTEDGTSMLPLSDRFSGLARRRALTNTSSAPLRRMLPR